MTLLQAPVNITGTVYAPTRAYVIDSAGQIDAEDGDVPFLLAEGFTNASVLHAGKATLGGNQTYFVRSDGNDDNDGLTDSASGAWLTLSHAYTWLTQHVDQVGFVVTVEVRRGPYVGFYSYLNGTASGPIYFHGDDDDVTAVTISPNGQNCVGVANGNLASNIWISDVTFVVPGGDIAVVAYYSGAQLVLGASPDFSHIGNINFSGGNASSRLVVADFGADVEIYGNITISSTALSFAFGATNQGKMYVDINSLTVSPGLTVGTSFIYTNIQGNARYGSAAGTGTVTGHKYSVNANSVLTQTTTVPGTLSGTTATGGQVI